MEVVVKWKKRKGGEEVGRRCKKNEDFWSTVPPLIIL
jgi:hypothetical protein